MVMLIKLICPICYYREPEDAVTPSMQMPIPSEFVINSLQDVLDSVVGNQDNIVSTPQR